MLILHLSLYFEKIQGISENCDKIIAFSEKCATIIKEFY